MMNHTDHSTETIALNCNISYVQDMSYLSIPPVCQLFAKGPSIVILQPEVVSRSKPHWNGLHPELGAGLLHQEAAAGGPQLCCSRAGYTSPRWGTSHCSRHGRGWARSWAGGLTGVLPKTPAVGSRMDCDALESMVVTEPLPPGSALSQDLT